MGTRWLIRDDLLVTAGHVVYDRSLGCGAATQIKCYLGYHGKRSLGSFQTQARYGSKVVTTNDWTQDGDRPKDVAFIQVNMPFTGSLSPFQYVDTPSVFDGKIGLVGYPADQSVHDKKGMNEQGAGMYEIFQSTKYDLATSSLNMVEYRMSTFGGASLIGTQPGFVFIYQVLYQDKQEDRCCVLEPTEALLLSGSTAATPAE